MLFSHMGYGIRSFGSALAVCLLATATLSEIILTTPIGIKADGKGTVYCLFYTEESYGITEGKEAAAAFADANGKYTFQDLFGPNTLLDTAFGNPSTDNQDICWACSEAMARYASEVLITECCYHRDHPADEPEDFKDDIKLDTE
ncbi:Uu.00g072160.m01.CDS01 [Anthostomella pinea]|uniref:Uu.00g072160.m01.CDS01 n=1 Tax=Anthostomella pinea TaxID=933095 RepID=A0AAI8VPE0_9PEZI|nr:Uu.00g072160.m01.CDS01 [Anthostomella pinea]